LCKLCSIKYYVCQFMITFRRTTAWNGKTHNSRPLNDGDNDPESIEISLGRGFFSMSDL
jgi:hypothetical protein